MGVRDEPQGRLGLEAVGALSSRHTCLSLAQVPFWNGCNEDEHCVPDLLLDARSDLPTAM